MSTKQVKLLFILSFAAMLVLYAITFGYYKTVNIILDEYILILLTIPLLIISMYFKQKLKYIEVIDFNKNSNISLKSTLIFFLFFQVVDYIYEDGFIGMISQWFIYWIMGVITFMVLNIINYYRNYKLLKIYTLQKEQFENNTF